MHTRHRLLGETLEAGRGLRAQPPLPVGGGEHVHVHDVLDTRRGARVPRAARRIPRAVKVADLGRAAM
eukprot:scaffold40301_cov72-Phaeocystis_antarctica.AAC.4